MCGYRPDHAMLKVSDILRLRVEEKAREKSFRHRRSQVDSTMRNGIIHSTFILLVFFFLLASSTVALSADSMLQPYALTTFESLDGLLKLVKLIRSVFKCGIDIVQSTSKRSEGVSCELERSGSQPLQMDCS